MISQSETDKFKVSKGKFCLMVTGCEESFLMDSNASSSTVAFHMTISMQQFSVTDASFTSTCNTVGAIKLSVLLHKTLLVFSDGNNNKLVPILLISTVPRLQDDP